MHHAGNAFDRLLTDRLAARGHPSLVPQLGHVLLAQHIGRLVNLDQEPDAVHLPVADFEPPTLEQLRQRVAAVRDSLAAGTRVAVHCRAGFGRSGTLLAAYLVSAGRSPSAAIAGVRAARPGSVETQRQALAVQHFAADLASMAAAYTRAMPSLLERLTADLKDAMRGGEHTRRDEIRGLISMLKAEQQTKLTRALSKQGLILHGDNAVLTPEQQSEIERLRGTVALSEDEEQAVLAQRVKQHRQSIDGFVSGKRDDLVQIEQAQLAVDQAYLPQQLDGAAVEAAIQEALSEAAAQTVRDQGKVMGLLSGRLRGKADMKAVAARVQTLLSEPH